MFNRITRALAVRLTLLLTEQTQRIRRQPDAGMETADKVLWAAVVTVVVGVVGAIFRSKLTSFANGLSLTLGW